MGEDRQTVTVREWLRGNLYGDVADLIDQAMARWPVANVRTRRNWWEVLAGGMSGRPRSVYRQEFPVLRAAQIRQGLPVTPNALCRNPNETPPSIRITNRWPADRHEVPFTGADAPDDQEVDYG